MTSKEEVAKLNIMKKQDKNPQPEQFVEVFAKLDIQGSHSFCRRATTRNPNELLCRY
ncbi:MAG: hypothetical protein JSR17_06565 [Proteobacteria bacterium]|nr:hypothetical protein [Pseudomonadota bacterium]